MNLQPIIDFLQSNAIQFIIGSGILGFIGVYLIQQVLSNQNIDRLAENLDKAVDDIQKRDIKVGAELRSRLIYACNSMITALKADDGVN